MVAAREKIQCAWEPWISSDRKGRDGRTGQTIGGGYASAGPAKQLLRSFLHGLTELGPRRNPGPASLFVDALRQPGDADRSDELAVDRKRHSPADQIDLAGIHVHDPEIPIGPRLEELGEIFRG